MVEFVSNIHHYDYCRISHLSCNHTVIKIADLDTTYPKQFVPSRGFHRSQRVDISRVERCILIFILRIRTVLSNRGAFIDNE